MTRRIRVKADEAWKGRAVCREKVLDYVRRGWAYADAQRYVTDLYYVPGDGLKPGRPPKGQPRLPEEDLLFLPRLWCSACPVQAECLEEALTLGDIHGFRAGRTPNEIRRLVRARRRARLLARSG